jgi:hypothetical protein
MQRRYIAVVLIAGLAALIVVISLARCPPDVCRALHIQTYTIASLDEYRQFLVDEAAFTALHHVRAVRVNCSDLRDAVVTALKNGAIKVGAQQAEWLQIPERPWPDPSLATGTAVTSSGL